jgi:hypothetical protein
MASRDDKMGLHGSVPPWFAGLLPEGALRELVFTGLGRGDHDQFDVLIARVLLKNTINERPAVWASPSKK